MAALEKQYKCLSSLQLLLRLMKTKKNINVVKEKKTVKIFVGPLTHEITIETITSN